MVIARSSYFVSASVEIDQALHPEAKVNYWSMEMQTSFSTQIVISAKHIFPETEHSTTTMIRPIHIENVACLLTRMHREYRRLFQTYLS